MALKITTQIGTDKGITSEAYVRIADYQVNKSGTASLRIELFQSQADSIPSSVMMPMTASGQARNQQVGENMWIALTKQVEKTRTVQKNVEVDVPAVGVEGEEGYLPASKKWEMQDVEETYMATVPDLSPLEDATIFAFGYGKLKEKLVDLFGADNVLDC